MEDSKLSRGVNVIVNVGFSTVCLVISCQSVHEVPLIRSLENGWIVSQWVEVSTAAAFMCGFFPPHTLDSCHIPIACIVGVLKTFNDQSV